jgi:hypothetical protein
VREVRVRTSLEITFLPGSEAIDAVFGDAGAQPDHLCGPYWTSLLLRTRGWDVDPVRVAIAAGTLLPTRGDPASWVPPGEPNRAVDHAMIARTDDPARSGTSVPGLVLAAASLSDGAARVVAVRGEAAGPFGAAGLERLIELLEANPGWAAAPLLNLRTGPLWGTRPAIADALRYLDGHDVVPPPPEWDVGHYVSLAGVVRGHARSVLVLRDSYPSFGGGGYHVQPLDAVAAALRRGDGVEGGCLLMVAAADVPEIERELKEAGFEIGPWDNGTPYEGGDR